MHLSLAKDRSYTCTCFHYYSDCTCLTIFTCSLRHNRASRSVPSESECGHLEFVSCKFPKSRDRWRENCSIVNSGSVRLTRGAIFTVVQCKSQNNSISGYPRGELPVHWNASRVVDSHTQVRRGLWRSWKWEVKRSYQGAKEIIFTAGHSGKLKLASTSPDVISTSLKSFLTSRIDFTVLLLFEFLKKYHLPVGQVKNRIH